MPSGNSAHHNKTARARVFFALDPNPDVRAQVVSARGQLDWRARKVPVRNLHMTLVFVGDVDRDELPLLLEAGKRQRMPSVALRLDQSGWFPRSRVGWLGCERVPGALIDFRTSLFEALDAMGTHRDRGRWSPHVTLYRDLRKRPGNMAFEPIEWRLRDFVLMESRQGKNGLVYAPLGRWPAG